VAQGQALSARPDLREKAFVTTKVSNGPFTGNNYTRHLAAKHIWV
jgi:aryl-alcohol dehydrogenase-like predicted oxidoreductase